MKKIILFLLLMLFCFPAIAEEDIEGEVGYRTYMRSVDYYDGQEFMVQLKVRKFVRDEDDNVLIYAYSDDNTSNVFCLKSLSFDSFLWYDMGLGVLGLTVDRYAASVAQSEELRLSLQPVAKVEKLLKGDKIIARVVGGGLTDEDEPLCYVLWLVIDD